MIEAFTVEECTRIKQLYAQLNHGGLTPEEFQEYERLHERFKMCRQMESIAGFEAYREAIGCGFDELTARVSAVAHSAQLAGCRNHEEAVKHLKKPGNLKYCGAKIDDIDEAVSELRGAGLWPYDGAVN